MQLLQCLCNIVWIYGESLECIYLDEVVFFGLMFNFNCLVFELLDVCGLVLVEGSGWIIVGLVLLMCGVLLIILQGDENSMNCMGSFLFKVVCLGDYLKQQGYINYYLGGVNGQFVGKGQFLVSYGFDEVYDLVWFKQQKKIGCIYYLVWGVYDDVLLDIVYQCFEQFLCVGLLFMLIMLIMDIYYLVGYLLVLCKGECYWSGYGDIGLFNVFKCIDCLILQLVECIQVSLYGKDMLIVIVFDYLVMFNDFSYVLVKQKCENLLLFFGDGIVLQQFSVDVGIMLDFGVILFSLLDLKLKMMGFGCLLIDLQCVFSVSVVVCCDDGCDYLQYLVFVCLLWLGELICELKIDGDDQVVVGLQYV